jgi:hypothetical protein
LAGGDRSRVDDLAAAALRGELADRFLHADQHPEAVDLHDAAEAVLGDVEERLRAADAGVVEDHVQLTELVDRSPDEVLDARLFLELFL